MLCVCAHHSASGTSRGKCGPHGELFFFLNKKEYLALKEAVQFLPFFPAETLMACALIGLHLMAAEGESVFFLILLCLFAGAGRDSRAQWPEVPSVASRCILLRK